ncbi:uncharacterized protein LOC119104381 [Pollicipes pollicipes]|uniref:uncharacterized protein LOC119104381 n=1 Tax=Pollicipes pollicipes TaxID=41117 RepID=UPI001884A47D|nr:uncharacterized protein LOC119104381 [Pollicipes pollicipes]
MGLISPKKGPGFDGVRPSGSPHRIVIKSSQSLQSKTVASVASSAGQPAYRLLTQPTVQQAVPGRQGVQFVRVVGSAGGLQNYLQSSQPAAHEVANTAPGAVKVAIAPSQARDL